MFSDLLDIACRQGHEARALASRYVARYGVDAPALARMALADVRERGRHARAALYAEAIAILAIQQPR
jgi:hypothetical protein